MKFSIYLFVIVYAVVVGSAQGQSVSVPADRGLATQREIVREKKHEKRSIFEFSATSPGATVSIAQLLHKVPSKAMKEYREALKAFDNQNVNRGTVHLENAVQIDPGYLEAQRELGTSRLQTDQPDLALVAFEQVLKIDPRSIVAYAGSGFALLLMNQFADAERCARQALEIDRSNFAAHYVLGLSLAVQEKNHDEAVRHLTQVSKAIPHARVALASIWAHQGLVTQATTELEDYLKNDPANTEGARALLDRLKKIQQSTRRAEQ